MASELRLPRLNYVILSGRLTRDVDLRYTPTGTPVAKLSLAFDRNYQKGGEWLQETSYMEVVVWSKRGEQCAEFLRKGNAVVVEGYIRTRSFVDRENQQRKITEIVANKVSFLEKTSYPSDSAESEMKDDDQSGPVADVTDDDVPF